MLPNYNGHSCTYSPSSNTYGRPPVSVRFPCSTCGSERPREWVQGASGGWKLELLKCCSVETETETRSNRRSDTEGSTE